MEARRCLTRKLLETWLHDATFTELECANDCRKCALLRWRDEWAATLPDVFLRSRDENAVLEIKLCRDVLGVEEGK